jgi:hypothetical protein
MKNTMITRNKAVSLLRKLNKQIESYHHGMILIDDSDNIKLMHDIVITLSTTDEDAILEEAKRQLCCFAIL